jgi:hypothetical protein
LSTLLSNKPPTDKVAAVVVVVETAQEEISWSIYPSMAPVLLMQLAFVMEVKR